MVQQTGSVTACRHRLSVITTFDQSDSEDYLGHVLQITQFNLPSNHPDSHKLFGDVLQISHIKLLTYSTYQDGICHRVLQEKLVASEAVVRYSGDGQSRFVLLTIFGSGCAICG